MERAAGTERSALRCERAAAILPPGLRQAVLSLTQEQKARAEEFRLRTGQPLSVVFPEGEQTVGPQVTGEDLEHLCNLATEFSRYAAAETIREGYLPVRGGFRVGLCGTGVIKSGANMNLKDLSSAAVRIGREHIGLAEPLVPELLENGQLCSTLLISPPGGGKTTLLRDLVRCLSVRGRRVTLIDERGEVAAMYQGRPQLDVGPCTDVLDGVPKAVGIPMVLRAMNPEIIAVDEITAAADLEAMAMAAGCGTVLLATIHGGDLETLEQKPLCRALLEQRTFRRWIRITGGPEGRRYTVEAVP